METYDYIFLDSFSKKRGNCQSTYFIIRNSFIIPVEHSVIFRL